MRASAVALSQIGPANFPKRESLPIDLGNLYLTTPQKALACQPYLPIRAVFQKGKQRLTGKNFQGLGSSDFARHYFRNHWLFSFPLPTKMFQFGSLPSHALYIQAWITGHYPGWVAPFGNLRIKACLSASRSLSQTTTSFIGVLRQGILYVRLSNFCEMCQIWV